MVIISSYICERKFVLFSHSFLDGWSEEGYTIWKQSVNVILLSRGGCSVGASSSKIEF